MKLGNSMSLKFVMFFYLLYCIRFDILYINFGYECFSIVNF